ncbi:hypothetical protein PY093_06320 [Cytobacillus sp. S13-E01]|nr:hypothetical protein [Cytobacillus sp. S13-E01]MDF0726329.1 hypothetical protein [Cytobacillus sp. S13-E01]
MEVRVLTALDAADYLKLRLEALQQDPDENVYLDEDLMVLFLN